MNTQSLHTRVCIIGAGPAGAATAIFLGKEQIHHTIIDAATFPRDKICGDGLDLKAITMLNHIDTSILENKHSPMETLVPAGASDLFTPTKLILNLFTSHKAAAKINHRMLFVNVLL